MGRKTYSRIDDKGRTVYTLTPGFEAATTEYDTRGRISKSSFGSGPDAFTYTYTYDSSGQKASDTDSLGRATTFAYDDIGRKSATTQPGGLLVQFGYDANGNRVSVTPPERLPYLFTFDALNRETDFNPPDIGLPVDNTAISRSPDGQVLTVTRPDGKIITNSYDSGGRLLKVTMPEAAIDVAYQPGEDRIASVTRTAADGSAQTTSYTYDGQLLIAKQESGAVNYSATLAYDNNYWTTSQTINGQPIAYTYDNDGLITSAGALSIARSTQNGAITGTALGSVAETFTYSPFGDVTVHQVKYAGAVVYQVDYVRDLIGRITKKTEAIQGVTKIHEYSYDAAGRLAGVMEDGVTVASYIRLERKPFDGGDTVRLLYRSVRHAGPYGLIRG